MQSHLEGHLQDLRQSLDEKQRSSSQEIRRLQEELLNLQQVSERQHAALERRDQDLGHLRSEVEVLRVSPSLRSILLVWFRLAVSARTPPRANCVQSFSVCLHYGI